MAHGLPMLPAAAQPAEREIIQFAGIDRRNSAPAGSLTDCRNLSWREFPCLSQRLGRKTMQGYENEKIKNLAIKKICESLRFTEQSKTKFKALKSAKF